MMEESSSGYLEPRRSSLRGILYWTALYGWNFEPTVKYRVEEVDGLGVTGALETKGKTPHPSLWGKYRV